MSAAEGYLFEDQAPLKPSVMSGMRLANKADLLKASRPTRPDPDEKGEVRAYVHRRDVILKFKGHRQGPGGGPRGAIRGFTHASRRRLSFAVRNTNDLWDGFLTLTYPADFKNDGRAVKRDLNAFCSWLRRKKVAYIWILEFQRRGAPHFHFLVKGWLDKTDVAERWADIVGSWDRARHVKAGTRIEGVKNPDQVGSYMAAYMNKLEQKVVPKAYTSVGRFWARLGCFSPLSTGGAACGATRRAPFARRETGMRRRTGRSRASVG